MDCCKKTKIKKKRTTKFGEETIVLHAYIFDTLFSNSKRLLSNIPLSFCVVGMANVKRADQDEYMPV